MTSIAIMTDTDSSLPEALTKKHNIRQVPIGIHFNEDIFEAVFDIDDAQLFERIDKEGKLPTTSAPSAGNWAKAYEDAFEAGADEVICFCVSAAVSGTYASALAAVDMVPGRQITVIDTQSLAIGQGFMVLKAAELAEAGASRDEIIVGAMDVQKRTVLFGALATLKYVAMSGRVGYLAAGFANLLNVKPIMTIRDGKLDLLERVRTQRKAWGRMIELSKERLGDHSIEQLALLHVNAESSAKQFHELFQAQCSCPQDYILSDLTPGLSVHTGAGLVGVSFVMSH
jgi:DegV family protein with EDD domain